MIQIIGMTLVTQPCYYESQALAVQLWGDWFAAV